MDTLNPLDQCEPFSIEVMAVRTRYLKDDEHALLDKIHDRKLRLRIYKAMKITK